jgi:hypothetical protein
MVNETERIWNNLGRFIGNLDIEMFGSILSLVYLKQYRLGLSHSKVETECNVRDRLPQGRLSGRMVQAYSMDTIDGHD